MNINRNTNRLVRSTVTIAAAIAVGAGIHATA